jgi:hypothetical protein
MRAEKSTMRNLIEIDGEEQGTIKIYRLYSRGGTGAGVGEMVGKALK